MIVASPYWTDYFGGGTTVSDGMDVAMARDATPVSYTHLTLPTIYSV